MTGFATQLSENEFLGDLSGYLDARACFTQVQGRVEVLGAEKKSDLRGRDIREFIDFSDHRAVERAISATLRKAKTGRRVVCRSLILPSAMDDATPRFLEVLLLQDKPRRVSFCLRDVTYWQQRELALNKQVEDLQAKDKENTERMVELGHELRTPLNAIVGFSQMMDQALFGPLENEKYKNYTQLIHRSSRYLLDLVANSLEQLRVKDQRYLVRPEQTDVKELLRECVGIMRYSADVAGLRIVFHEPDGDFHGSVDPVLVRQVVLNLLTNAVKFTSKGGVDLYLQEDKGQFRISVMDTGRGMTEEELQKFTTPRPQDIDSTQGQSGVGVPLMRALSALHKGTLEYRSALGKGTRAVFRIPAIADDEGFDLDTADETGAGTPAAIERSGSLKTLRESAEELALQKELEAEMGWKDENKNKRAGKGKSDNDKSKSGSKGWAGGVFSLLSKESHEKNSKDPRYLEQARKTGQRGSSDKQKSPPPKTPVDMIDPWLLDPLGAKEGRLTKDRLAIEKDGSGAPAIGREWGEGEIKNNPVDIDPWLLDPHKDSRPDDFYEFPKSASQEPEASEGEAEQREDSKKLEEELEEELEENPVMEKVDNDDESLTDEEEDPLKDEQETEKPEKVRTERTRRPDFRQKSKAEKVIDISVFNKESAFANRKDKQLRQKEAARKKAEFQQREKQVEAPVAPAPAAARASLRKKPAPQASGEEREKSTASAFGDKTLRTGARKKAGIARQQFNVDKTREAKEKMYRDTQTNDARDFGSEEPNLSTGKKKTAGMTDSFFDRLRTPATSDKAARQVGSGKAVEDRGSRSARSTVNKQLPHAVKNSRAPKASERAIADEKKSLDERMGVLKNMLSREIREDGN